MAKLTVICLVYIIVGAAFLTSCFALRPLRIDDPSDKTDAVMSSTRRSGSAPDLGLTRSQTSSTKMESDKAFVERQQVMTDFESEKRVDIDEMNPCVEHTDSGRRCHRMLDDYGPPGVADDPKRP